MFFLQEKRSETPNLKVFLALLDSKIKCERQIAIKNSNYEKYRAKWTTLCNYDAWSTLSMKVLSKGIFYYLLYVSAWCECMYVCCVSFAPYAV